MFVPGTWDISLTILLSMYNHLQSIKMFFSSTSLNLYIALESPHFFAPPLPTLIQDAITFNLNFCTPYYFLCLLHSKALLLIIAEVIFLKHRSDYVTLLSKKKKKPTQLFFMIPNSHLKPKLLSMVYKVLCNRNTAYFGASSPMTTSISYNL